MSKKNNTTADNTIALNRKASHDYHFEASYEAGMELMGWELKSIRQGRMNLKESYVLIKQGQAWVIGMHISPLVSASTHVQADPTRTRRLLLNRVELKKLIGATQRDGYTVIIQAVYWKRNWVKARIALAKGKQDHDKRAAEKSRDWQKEKARILKTSI
jgi:SsrA-binding protein